MEVGVEAAAELARAGSLRWVGLVGVEELKEVELMEMPQEEAAARLCQLCCCRLLIWFYVIGPRAMLVCH